MLEDSFDCFLSVMVLTNNNINAVIDEKVTRELEEASRKVLLNEITFNETFTNLDLLVEEKKWIVQTYSGDAASYQTKNPYIKFFFPEKAYNAWSEVVCVTANSPNRENAYKLLNFLTEAENAAAFSNEFYYANGIKGSHKFMSEEIRKNPLINIDENTRKNGVFYLKSKESNSVMQRIYSQISNTENKENHSDEKED